ncbi:MAG: GNAT family N-acetyltransferase [Ilumatobacteraceae bacterium]
MPPLHLAQVNIGTLRQPIDHPDTVDFADALDPVNAEGEASPGYVWRLQDDSGNATSIQIFDNPLQLLNVTVWESVEALRAFAYRGSHRDFFRRRAEWFEPDGSATALWWIPAGTLPTEYEAARRVDFIRRFGDSPFAFRIGSRQPQLVIARTDLDSPEAQEMIAALDAELTALYPEPGATHFSLGAAEVATGRGGFYVAYLDGAPAGCGAYRTPKPGTAEIKRMYVDPSARGLKLGAAILDTLEEAARGDGAAEIILETGHRQTEALGLYHRFGFNQIPVYGEYVDSASTSVCFGKRLSAVG